MVLYCYSGWWFVGDVADDGHVDDEDDEDDVDGVM